MLQQTQVGRVEEVFPRFTGMFPGFAALDRASLGDVIAGWQGLGYNRRALALKKIASRVVEEWEGVLPDDENSLRSLPGIGCATAAAVRAFAFGKPSILIETNIRRVFIHCYFRGRSQVKDSEILPLVAETLDRENPRDWYYALMDYGAHLGRMRENPNRRSSRYRKQEPFEGSVRQARGRILSALARKGSIPAGDLDEEIGLPGIKIEPVLSALAEEGFIERDQDLVRLSS